MPILQWNDTYSVKNAEFDGQHRKLFGLINELHDAMSQGRGRDIAAKILTDLADYTRTHFASEESLMVRYNYPQYQTHKAAHVELSTKVEQFQEDFAMGKVALSIQLMQFLKDWLSNHIQKTDKLYAGFFEEKGVK